MDTTTKGKLFLGGMLLCLLFILLTGPLFLIQNLTTSMVEIFGLLLIFWALLARKVEKHNNHDLPAGSFFVKHGPYEIIRHPVYAGTLLIAMSLVEYNFVFLRVFALILLMLLILLKIMREEFILSQKLPEYQTYKKNTKQLIPYLF